jgi:pimeloyl-ACP methyl ester carboxylesterase
MTTTSEQDCRIFAEGSAYTNFDSTVHDIPQPLPLPGIIIFVHGVNSDGEWYEACEQGLCAGLNNRLGRRTDQMKYPGPASGQLTPNKYGDELTDDGFISPDLNPNTFFDGASSASPVIRFRWGYKASSQELQLFGDSIYLNEKNYWGGGPFANGCTALPDLWNEGLSERLFLWMQVQHMNPVNERDVYSCPHRGYFVLAAYRLAKLVEAIRKEQADVPITIVCHSQGNMIGMAAAFLGDRLPVVTDADGRTGPCIADNYVLCNPPYSLVAKNFAEEWTQQNLTDPRGRTGRQTHAARIATLAAFFDLLRQRRELDALQTAARIDRLMANPAGGFTAKQDRTVYGINGSTYGRVTLYCNPHDQVISAVTVQGIGWSGIGKRKKFDEIAATGADGVLVQRVFAQGFKVGTVGPYHYWNNHWRKPTAGSDDFWLPHSKVAGYFLDKGLEADQSLLASAFTVIAWPVMALSTAIFRPRVNALPETGWEIPITAPALPAPFLPQSLRFGQPCVNFDQGYDPPGASRDAKRTRGPDEPYAGDRNVPADGRESANEKPTDAASGNNKDEAALRYEHHALVRMQAKRERRYRNGDQVVEEDEPEKASAEHNKWRNNLIKKSLLKSVDAAATDHSTIMTNPMHSERALAYDVAVGVCDISQPTLYDYRLFADWRFQEKLDKTDEKIFKMYFIDGQVDSIPLSQWIKDKKNGVEIPIKLIDTR